jgi:flagellar biosynthesis chaperone FliJ
MNRVTFFQSYSHKINDVFVYFLDNNLIILKEKEMAEKDNILLREFEDLIHTIGKEVSEEISAPVSAEVAKNVIDDQVMRELHNLINHANELITIMPKVAAEIKQVERDTKKISESIQKTSVQIDNHMTSITQEHQMTSDLLNQTSILSYTAKNEMKEFLDQLDSRLEIRNRNLVMKMEKMEHCMMALQEKVMKQDALIEAMRVELHNRGVQ